MFISNPKPCRNGSQVEESRHDAYNTLYVYDTSHSGATEELGGRTMVNFIHSFHASLFPQRFFNCLISLQLLSLREGETLAMNVRSYQDPIRYILFCVNLLYADDNASASVTRIRTFDQDNESIEETKVTVY